MVNIPIGREVVGRYLDGEANEQFEFCGKGNSCSKPMGTNFSESKKPRRKKEER